MQPSRTLEQILSQLDTVYQPQIESVRQRQALIPGQIQAEEQGLQAKQTQAFDDILGGARRRGLGFSGIPLAEQARYTSTEFLPAMARLRQSGRERAMSLEDAILSIQERRGTQAQSIYQQEQDRALQQRQAAAQANPLAAYFEWLRSQGNPGNQTAPGRPSLDDIFTPQQTVQVRQSTGSTIPLKVTPAAPQPTLRVGVVQPTQRLAVR